MGGPVLRSRIEMDNQKAQEITIRLKQRGVVGQCPMCLNKKFSVNGTATQELDDKVGGLKGILDRLDGKGEFGPIPMVVTVCTQCGFVARYSLSVLGLDQAEEQP